MTIVFQKSILKSKAAKRIVADAKLAYFKEKVFEHLDALEAKEKKREQAVQKALLWEETLRKAAYPVGTVREWKGKKYIKTAPGKWRRKYDSDSRGAKLSIAAIKRKVDKCETVEELLEVAKQNKHRFTDADGKYLPFVREMFDYVGKKHKEIKGANAGGSASSGKGKAKAGGSGGGDDGGDGGDDIGEIKRIQSVKDIQDDDFKEPHRSVALPAMTSNFYEQTGVEKKEILIKKNIFDKNRIGHKELTPEDGRKILNAALYETTGFIKDKPATKPNYYMLVKLDNGKNAVVCLDTAPEKEYHEIVGWRYAKAGDVERIKKRAAKEGAHFLITETAQGDSPRSAGLSDVQGNSATTVPQSGGAVKQETQKNAGKRGTAETPDELAQQFGLRGVEISDKVDAKTAQWHVKKCSEGLADIADITGIPDKLVSLNGRLSLAIGMRDKRNALASYSADLRSINISKTRGAGSLAHEWFHAFDNLIQEAMGGYNLTPRSFMSQRFLELSDEQAELLRNYLAAPKGSKERREYKKKSEAEGVFGVYLPDETTEEHQIKVLMAIDELAKAMTDGDVAVPQIIRFTAKDEKDAEKWVRADADGIAGDICRAGDFDAAIKIIRERFSRRKNREKWFKIAAAHYRKYSKYRGRVTEIDSGERSSAFLIAANKMDTGGSYWSLMREMAARAFEAYIGDKLAEQGRRNDYLIKDNTDGRAFPQGEERKRINAAFDKLFRVIAETNAIRKALKTTAKKKRWLWVEDGKVWIKKSVMDAWKRAMAE